MRPGLYTLYRIFGVIMNLLSYLLLFFSVAILFEAGLQSGVLPYLCISICMVIYSTLSRLFSVTVMQKQQPIRKSLKDWIKVNAYVSILALGYSTVRGFQQITDQRELKENIARMNEVYASKSVVLTPQMVYTTEVIVLALLSMAVAHCIWTLVLVSRNKDYFQEL